MSCSSTLIHRFRYHAFDLSPYYDFFFCSKDERDLVYYDFNTVHAVCNAVCGMTTVELAFVRRVSCCDMRGMDCLILEEYIKAKFIRNTAIDLYAMPTCRHKTPSSP